MNGTSSLPRATYTLKSARCLLPAEYSSEQEAAEVLEAENVEVMKVIVLASSDGTGQSSLGPTIKTKTNKNLQART